MGSVSILSLFMATTIVLQSVSNVQQSPPYVFYKFGNTRNSTLLAHRCRDIESHRGAARIGDPVRVWSDNRHVRGSVNITDECLLIILAADFSG